MPREGKFFDLFNAHAEQVVLGGAELVALMATVGVSVQEAETHAKRIDAIESAADRIAHDTIAVLHRTFITPLDRDSIHKLISNMDDILDLIQDVAESLVLYDVQAVSDEARQLASITQESCVAVQKAVALLSNMENAATILKHCQEIDRLESDADRVMRSAISHLFRNESDVRQLIKFKAIYEMLESITDRCEDVANTVESIVLDNS